MLVPGTSCAGSLSHLSSVASFQTMSALFNASEYRKNFSTVPTLRLQICARLGPVKCSPGFTEWQAMHAWNTCAPRFGSPAAKEPLPTANERHPIKAAKAVPQRIL